MSDRDEQVDSFCKVTGVSAGRAQFFLEASGWDANAAISAYYEQGESDDALASDSEPMRTSQQAAEPVAAAPAPVLRQAAEGTADARGSRRFATLSSLASAADDAKSDEKGQEFFAGGSEHSGQVISGPPKKKRHDPRDLADSVMSAAKEQGAEAMDEEPRQQKPKSTFTGSGYRLGETPEESKVVVQNAPAHAQRQEREVAIHFFRDGFSVDDGPLRDGQSDEDKKFLKDISQGVVPEELEQKYGRKGVSVKLVDNRDSEYVAPKKKREAFTGSGNRLGSPAPTFTSSTAAATSAASTAAAPAEVQVDDSQPLTTIQIRLADGTRLVSKFNTSHTVQAVRDFINASRPAMAGKNYYLMTSFPSKEIGDESATLAQANLLNSVVMQRMR